MTSRSKAKVSSRAWTRAVVSPAVDAGHLGAEADRPAGRAHVVGERLGDGAVVGDRGGRRVQAGDSGGVRLDLAELVVLEPAEAGHAVCDSAALELPQAHDLGRVERDDELAAVAQRDAAARGVRAQELDAAPAQLRLERARRVVDPRVDDAAVAAGLVERHLPLLLEDLDRRVGLELGRGAERRRGRRFRPRSLRCASTHRRIPRTSRGNGSRVRLAGDDEVGRARRRAGRIQDGERPARRAGRDREDDLGRTDARRDGEDAADPHAGPCRAGSSP